VITIGWNAHPMAVIRYARKHSAESAEEHNAAASRDHAPHHGGQ
jgi:hypothetical protein